MSDVNDPAQWVRVAEEDLLAIKSILAGRPVAWGVVCYLSQQAGEKLLKGFLAAHGVPVRRIHDLGALLSECVLIDSSLGTLPLIAK